MLYLGYQQYGISPQLVDRIKLKMKNPAVKERVKNMITGISKQEPAGYSSRAQAGA